MLLEQGVFVVAGLGNPGKAYQDTRHNVGFAVARAFAEKHHLTFQKTKWQSDWAEGIAAESRVIVMMPKTFMNASGEAVAALMGYLQIPLSHLLVVVDDVAIPVGALRIRTDSGSGGHNGLKSIALHLQTNGFARLRVGVGDRESGDLSEHVLGKFTPEEAQMMPQVIERAVQAIEIWLAQGLNRAMEFANRDPSNPSNGEKTNE